MTAVALYEIGKYGLVLSGQNVLDRTFKRFAVGDIDAELFAEGKKIAPRIPIAGGKLIDKLVDAGRTLAHYLRVLATADRHCLVECALQLRLEIGRRRFPALPRGIAAFAPPEPELLGRAGVSLRRRTSMRVFSCSSSRLLYATYLRCFLIL